jgi:hypothetical protein
MKQLRMLVKLSCGKNGIMNRFFCTANRTTWLPGKYDANQQAARITAWSGIRVSWIVGVWILIFLFDSSRATADNTYPEDLLLREGVATELQHYMMRDYSWSGGCLTQRCLYRGCLCDRMQQWTDDWMLRTEFLPGDILYPSYMAAPFQARMGTQLHGVVGDGAKWDTTLGGRFGWIRTYGHDGTTIGQLDLEGSTVVRTDPESSLDVDFTDFRIGLPYTIAHGRHRFKVGYEHLCSHLGDEYVMKHGLTTRDNYARDAIVLGYGNYIEPQTRVYGEVSYGWRTNVARPWHFQFGVDSAPMHMTGFQGAPFWAVNGLLRQETRFGGTMNLQAGWAWRNQEIGRLLRTGLFMQSGKATNLSYSNTSETQVGWGFWYDF